MTSDRSSVPIFVTVFALLALPLQVVAVTNSADSFEASFEQAGTHGGYFPSTTFTQNFKGWLAGDADSARVTNLFSGATEASSNSYLNISPYPITDYTHDQFSQVLSIDGGVTQYVESAMNARVWIDFLLQPVRWTEDSDPVVDASTHLAFYYNSNGFLTAYMTTNLNGSLAGWLKLPNSFRESNEWARVTLKLDYSGAIQPFSEHFFQVYVNSIVLSNQFGFSTNVDGSFGHSGVPEGGTWFAMADSTAQMLSQVALRNTGKLDDFTVSSNSPFLGDTFPILAQVDGAGGGLIDPSGLLQVQSNFNQTFSFIPDLGFDVSQIVVDGVTHVGSFSSHTFSNVINAHTITVAFASQGQVTTNGVPHAWLAKYGLNPEDDVLNSDNNLTDNIGEYFFGLNPLDPDQDAIIFDVMGLDDGSTVICWLGGTNGSTNPFQIWASTNVMSNLLWSVVGTKSHSPTVTNYFTNAVGGDRSNYRVSVSSP